MVKHAATRTAYSIRLAANPLFFPSLGEQALRKIHALLCLHELLLQPLDDALELLDATRKLGRALRGSLARNPNNLDGGKRDDGNDGYQWCEVQMASLLPAILPQITVKRLRAGPDYAPDRPHRSV